MQPKAPGYLYTAGMTTYSGWRRVAVGQPPAKSCQAGGSHFSHFLPVFRIQIRTQGSSADPYPDSESGSGPRGLKKGQKSQHNFILLRLSQHFIFQLTWIKIAIFSLIRIRIRIQPPDPSSSYVYTDRKESLKIIISRFQ